MSQIHEQIASILAEYGRLPPKTPLPADHPLVQRFSTLKQELAVSPPVSHRPHLRIVWSVGKGGKTKVPWIALLDRRVTTSIRSGVYCVYLFRQDLSGVYLALGLGATGMGSQFYDVGREQMSALREKAGEMRPVFEELARCGFTVDGRIDLRTDTSLGRGYEAGTVAYRFYAASTLPTDDELLADLESLLGSYDLHASSQSPLDLESLSPTTRASRSTAEASPAPVTIPRATTRISDLHAAYAHHQEDLENRLLQRIKAMPSDRFEQFATYALRALGFVDMRTTRQTADGGIDATGTFSLGVGRVRAAAQFKRW